MSQPRAPDSVKVRSWVVGKTEEEILAVLRARHRELADGMAPHRAIVMRLADDLVEQSVRQCVSLPPVAAALRQAGRSPDEAISQALDAFPSWLPYILRVIAEHTVALYWARHPEGRSIPRITLMCPPWQVPSGMVSVLDLDLSLIRSPFLFGPPGQHDAIYRDILRRAPLVLPAGVSVTDESVIAALDEIELFRDRAWQVPLVRQVEAGLRRAAHHAPTRQERERAADHLADLHHASQPDFAREVRQHEGRLLIFLGEYNALMRTIEDLHRDLVAGGPSRGLLGRTKDTLREPRFDHVDLQRWRTQTPTAIAQEFLAAKYSEGRGDTPDLFDGPVSRKRIANCLARARTAEATREAWTDFEPHWKRLPGSERLALFPEPPQPASS